MTEYIKKHQGSLEIDWQRLLILKKICGDVGGLTPSPLRIDEKASAIVYEYLDFPDSLISQVKETSIYKQVGQTLAKMHKASFSIDEILFSKEPYPLQQLGLDKKYIDILDKNITSGWFHGDFWHGNIFLHPNTKIMIVDPIPNTAVFPENHIKASGALDVAFMYMSIIFCLPLHKQITININQHIRSSESFMRGYLDERKIYDIEVEQSVRCLSRCLAEIFIENYAKRLPQPLSSIKKIAALRILKLTDKKLNWNNR